MHKQVKRTLVLIAAIIFILLGLAGLVLPFLQGILFIFIGFILLSFCFPKVRPWINIHIKRFPHLLAIINKIENWIVKVIGEV